MIMIFVFILCVLCVFLLYQWFRTDLAYDSLEIKYEHDMKLMNDRCTDQALDHVHASKRNVQINQQLSVENDALRRAVAEKGKAEVALVKGSVATAVMDAEGWILWDAQGEVIEGWPSGWPDMVSAAWLRAQGINVTV